MVTENAEAVGTDDLTPLRGATPFGPPLGQLTVLDAPRPAGERAEQAVDAEEVGEALAVGEGQGAAVV
jgi:hypothetical protein